MLYCKKEIWIHGRLPHISSLVAFDPMPCTLRELVLEISKRLPQLPPPPPTHTLPFPPIPHIYGLGQLWQFLASGYFEKSLFFVSFLPSFLQFNSLSPGLFLTNPPPPGLLLHSLGQFIPLPTVSDLLLLFFRNNQAAVPLL